MARIDFILICLTLLSALSIQYTEIPLLIQFWFFGSKINLYLNRPKYWQVEIDGACADDYSHNSRCVFFFTFCQTLPEGN